MSGLPVTVSIERQGRWTFYVWASTVPAGGTSVDKWWCLTRKGAERKAARILARIERRSRYDEPEYIVNP